MAFGVSANPIFRPGIQVEIARLRGVVPFLEVFENQTLLEDGRDSRIENVLISGPHFDNGSIDSVEIGMPMQFTNGSINEHGKMGSSRWRITHCDNAYRHCRRSVIRVDDHPVV